MECWIDLAFNDDYEKVSAVCRQRVCIILRSAICLGSVPVIAISDLVQLSVSACPACRMSNFRCEVCAQGESYSARCDNACIVHVATPPL